MNPNLLLNNGNMVKFTNAYLCYSYNFIIHILLNTSGIL